MIAEEPYALMRARADLWEPWGRNSPGPPGRVTELHASYDQQSGEEMGQEDLGQEDLGQEDLGQEDLGQEDAASRDFGLALIGGPWCSLMCLPQASWSPPVPFDSFASALRILWDIG